MKAAIAALSLLLALAVFAAGVATEIRLPGLYFDEVYADYLVVPLIYSDALTNVAWLPPGNYLFNKFPLLVQIYHGALPLYAGLPMYAIFGTGIEGVRIVHGFFGAGVLIATWALMRAAQAPAWIAAMLCTALALDPSFLFAFRTQHYILLLPFVFSAAALLLADAAQAVQDGRRALVLIAASGLLGGIACYGYFVYFAFAPALAWFALANRTAAITRKRTLLAWGTGFAVGISPYPIGLALMVDALGGVSAAFAWLATTTANLKAGIDFGGPLDRVFWFGDQLQSMVTAEEFTRFLFGEQVGQSGAWSKTAFFAVAVLATMASLRAVRRADRIGLALAACLAGLFVLTLIFGRRLMAHHFLPALPILYVLLAIGASRWAQGASTTREPAPRADARLRTVMIVVSAIAVALVALNAVNARSVLERLRQTRGVWLFHESVTRFAEAEARQAGSVFYYFPDWGLFTSFAMITHGKLPFLAEFPTGQARMFLCSGRDVVVATTEGGDRRIADWTTKIGWTEPHIDYHRQRDGSLVFQTSRWFAQAGPRKEQPCPR